MKELKKDEVRKAVRETYRKIADAGTVGCGCDCGCGPGNNPNAEDVSVSLGYTRDDVSTVPGGANLGLGCGNPQAIASLQPGETVLDLGSGGGFDCFLAAKAVGETGHVIGMDMTPEMISKARENAESAGLGNVEFRLGEIEAPPVSDDAVDVIMSNCVINLSTEKPKVFEEAFRILKSGGRLAITDMVATAPLPDEVRQDLKLHAGCLAGAASIDEVKSMLEEAGFTDIRIKPIDANKQLVREWVPDTKIADVVFSATIEAVKPQEVYPFPSISRL